MVQLTKKSLDQSPSVKEKRRLIFSIRNPENMNQKYVISIKDLKGDKINLKHYTKSEYEDNSKYAQIKFKISSSLVTTKIIRRLTNG